MKVILERTTYVEALVIILTQDEHPSVSNFNYMSFSHNMNMVPNNYFNLILGKFKKILYLINKYPQVRLHILERPAGRMFREYVVLVTQRSDFNDFSVLQKIKHEFSQASVVPHSYLLKILQHNNGNVHISSKKADTLFQHYGFELSIAEYDTFYFTIDRKIQNQIRFWEGDYRLSQNINVQKIATALVVAPPSVHPLFPSMMDAQVIITDRPKQFGEKFINIDDIGFNLFHFISHHYGFVADFIDLMSTLYEHKFNAFQKDPFYFHLIADELITRTDPETILGINLRKLLLEESADIWQLLSRRDVKQILQTHYYKAFDLEFLNTSNYEALKETGTKIIDVSSLQTNEKVLATLFFLTLKKHGIIRGYVVSDTFRHLSRTRRFDKLDLFLQDLDLDDTIFYTDTIDHSSLISFPYSHLLLDLSKINDTTILEKLHLQAEEGLYLLDSFHEISPIVNPIVATADVMSSPMDVGFILDPNYDTLLEVDEESMHDGLDDESFDSAFEDFTIDFSNDLLRTTPILSAMMEYRAYTRHEIESNLDSYHNLGKSLHELLQVNFITEQQSTDGTSYVLNYTGRRRINTLVKTIQQNLADLKFPYEGDDNVMHLLDLQTLFTDLNLDREDREKLAFFTYHCMIKIVDKFESNAPLHHTLGFIDAVLALTDEDEDTVLELVDAFRLINSMIDRLINYKHEDVYQDVAEKMEDADFHEEDVDVDDIIESMSDEEDKSIQAEIVKDSIDLEIVLSEIDNMTINANAIIDQLDDLDLEEISPEIETDVISLDSFITHPSDIGQWSPAEKESSYQSLLNADLSIQKDEDLDLDSIFLFLLAEEYYPHTPFFLDQIPSPLRPSNTDRLVEYGYFTPVRDNQYKIRGKLKLKLITPDMEINPENLIQMGRYVMDDLRKSGFGMKMINKQRFLSIIDYFDFRDLYSHIISLNNARDDSWVQFYLSLIECITTKKKPHDDRIRYYYRKAYGIIPILEKSEETGDEAHTKRKLPDLPKPSEPKQEIEVIKEEDIEEIIIQKTEHVGVRHLEVEHIPDSIQKEFKWICDEFKSEGPDVLLDKILNHLSEYLTGKKFEINLKNHISAYTKSAKEYQVELSGLVSNFTTIRANWDQFEEDREQLMLFYSERIIDFFATFNFPVQFVEKLFYLIVEDGPPI